MTIKQYGGVFGRNPTFNNVTIDDLTANSLTVNGNGVIDGDLTLQSDKDLLLLATNPNAGTPFQYGEIRFGDSNAGQYVNHAFIKSSGIYASVSTLEFHTSNGDSSPLRMKIAEDGNVSIVTGNLAFASGKGIDFSATAGTGTSELLDDYEEGTWTPTYSPASGAFTSVTYNTNTYGRYTRIGRMVSIQGIIITDAITVGTAAGNIRIAGLPFSGEKDAAVGVGYGANFNVNNPSGGYVSGSVLFLTSRSTSNGAASISTVPDLSTVGTFQNYLIFSTTYVV